MKVHDLDDLDLIPNNIINMNFVNFLACSDSVLGFKLNRQTEQQLTSQELSLKPQASDKGLSFGPQTSSHSNIPSQGSLSLIMEERQSLINQYLQLNIKLLQKEIHDKKPIQVSKESQEEQKKSEIETHKKKIKKINTCGHEDKPHYAKGLCSNCYHRYGRVKKPWRCNHQKLYAGGMCQNCYINNYNRKRREEMSNAVQEKNIITTQNHCIIEQKPESSS